MKLLAVLIAVLAITPHDFVGTWTADFEGKTFVTLRLTEQAGTITGTMHHPTQINTSPKGDLLGVSGSFVDDEVSNVKITGNDLRFTTRDDDGEDIKYVLHLTGEKNAELSFADPPKEFTVPKPWKLERAEPKPQTALRRSR